MKSNRNAEMYYSLLMKLNVLIDAGNGDTDEADAIRDEMDGPWQAMTNHELAEYKMKISNDELLQTFREKTVCEWCGVRVMTGLDPAHVFARGRGDAFRMDIPENLAGLCRICHSKNHAGGRPNRDDLLLIVGHREKILVDDLEDHLRRLRWIT